MEFVQYHPTGLPFTGILITEAARAEGGFLVNKDGYRYLQDYNLGKPEPKPVLRTMELGPRDRLSQAFMKEVEKGRTLQGPYGPYVHLDLRHLGEKLINAKLPFVRELCQNYQNIDPVKEMIAVRPVVHYMMGGVHTDINGATPLPGLYAAGEVACVSINGANRLGSNSLPELLVFGARAGMAAAEYASRQKSPGPAIRAQAADEKRGLEELLRKTDGRETHRPHPRGDAEDDGGERRHLPHRAPPWRGPPTSCTSCSERARSLAIADHSRTFNTELTTALELTFMLELAQVMALSALKREESRGAHQRVDFPARDDKRFLAHSLARRQPDGTVRIEYLPVKITRWPPAERVYGK